MFEGDLEYSWAENMVVRPFRGAFSRPILGKKNAKSSLQVIFGPCIKAMLGVSQWYWGSFSEFQGGLDYVWAEHMVVRPFWGAFSRPTLRKNSAKSPLQVMCGPCIKAILGVFQGCFSVCLRVF